MSEVASADAAASPPARPNRRLTSLLRNSAQGVVTVLVTLLILLVEFGFLTGTYRLGNDFRNEQVAQAKLAATLTGSRDEAPAVAEAGRALDDMFEAGASTDLEALRAAAATWTAAPKDDEALADLRAETDLLGESLTAAQAGRDRLAMLIHAGALILISLAWFFWFRKLVRRQREVQRALTQQQVVDTGERRLLALVRNSADVVMVLEPDSTALFVSPSARSVLGYEPEALLHRPFVEVMDRDEARRLAEQLLSTRIGEHGVEFPISHADGRRLVVEGTLTNLTADPAVNGWVLTVRDVTERHELQEQLTHQAFHDSLTGLANRHLFADRLAHALRRREGRAEPQVVLYCDLDNFKNVNDTLGHGTGDKLLVAIGDLLRTTIREGDTAARLGGDEFAVLMEGADRATALEVADRLQQRFAEPILVDGERRRISASIGIAQARPGDDTCDNVLRKADVAMYWAKDRGRSTTAVYDSTLHAQASERLEMRKDLQRAVVEGEFVLHFQPTVDVATDTINGFEALVRWQHPKRGLLGPNEFVAVAEQTGAIVPLGEWVLTESCHAGALMQRGKHPVTIAVNIAAQQIAERDFVATVEAALSAAGLPAERLVLELTESALLDDVDAVIEKLTLLREIGVRIAIDDFGTGYSSLAYLAKLPVDILKVDKSFIDQAAIGADGVSVTEAIIAMGRKLTLTIVAEGVERPEQAAWLRELGCTVCQGYLWSRPVELDEALELLQHAGPTASEPPVRLVS